MHMHSTKKRMSTKLSVNRSVIWYLGRNRWPVWNRKTKEPKKRGVYSDVPGQRANVISSEAISMVGAWWRFVVFRVEF